MLVAFFIAATVVLVLVITALRPPLTHRSAAVRPPWFPVMIVTELAPIFCVVSVALMGAGVFFGAMSDTLGRIGLAFLTLSIAGLLWLIAVAARTGTVLDAALPEAADPARVSLQMALWPDPYRVPVDVEVTEDLRYADQLCLDLYGRSGSSHPSRPVMIQIHGGSWSGGSRDQQARPLIHGLAQRDWVVAAIDYPLVPDATFPDNLEAVHAAVGWVRRNAVEFRLDPSRIFLTGGSSGAHLASLAALTDGDMTVGSDRDGHPPLAGAVTFYGVYDLVNRHGVRDEWPIVAQGLMKTSLTDAPDRYAAASPLDRVHPDAPPFIIVHGRHDSLVPYAESEYFATALAGVSDNPVRLVLLPGASHAFDAVPSFRTQQVVAHLVGVLDQMARRTPEV